MAGTLLYAAAGEQPGVFAASVEGGAPKPILRSFTSATYTAEGYLLFHRQQNLMAQRFNTESLQLEGAAQEIAGSSPVAPSLRLRTGRSSIAPESGARPR